MLTPRSLSLICLMRSYWLSGNLDQALRCAETMVEEADSADHPDHGVQYARHGDVAVFLDRRFAAGRAQSRQDRALLRKNFVRPLWCGRDGAERPAPAPHGPHSGGHGVFARQPGETRCPTGHDVIAGFCSRSGRLPGKAKRPCGSFGSHGQTIAQQEEFNKIIYIPALILARARIFMHGEAPDFQLAEEHLEKSMALAREHSELSFELRAGLELARIWIRDGEVQRARDLIRPIYSRFSEGFGTPISFSRGKCSTWRDAQYLRERAEMGTGSAHRAPVDANQSDSLLR